MQHVDNRVDRQRERIGAMTKKAKERKYGEAWTCHTCEGNPAFESAPAILEHLRTVHGCTDPIHGKKSLEMHMDGKDWFSWQWGWDINGVKLTQVTCQARKKPWR